MNLFLINYIERCLFLFIIEQKMITVIAAKIASIDNTRWKRAITKYHINVIIINSNIYLNDINISCIYNIQITILIIILKLLDF